MIFNNKQLLALKYLHDTSTNEVIFGGGAGGGKSILGCYWAVKMAMKYPDTRYLIGRAKLKTLKETTLISFFKVCKLIGLQPYKNFKINGSTANENPNSIQFNNKSVILLKDLYYYPSDPNFDELGSLEITGAFIDECNQITEKAWNIVRSRIRHNLDDNLLIPKMLGTCNPSKGFIYNNFYKPHRDNTLPYNKKFIQSLVTDNPLISKYYSDNLKTLDELSRQRLLYGNWEYDDDMSVLMSYEKIVDIFSNNFVQGGLKYITCDVARMGKDKTKIRIWDGLRSIYSATYEKLKITDIANIIRNLQVNYSVPSSNTIADEDGVGGGLVDMLGCKGFVNNSRPIEINGQRTNYDNIRSQCYFELAKKINANEIYLSDTDIDERNNIVQELEQLKQIDFEKDGKLKVIGREQILRNIGRSPDNASCIMMRMYFEIYKPEIRKSHKLL